jgi:hypothetical protein
VSVIIGDEAIPPYASKKRKHSSKMINYAFVLIDLTTSKTPEHLRPAPAFDKLIDAWFEQIEGPYADEYGTQIIGFRKGSGEHDRKPDEVAVHFRDFIPEAPDALAYHQVVNGIPDIELGVNLFTSLGDDNDSLSSGGSHEMLELLGDAGANRWADRQNSSKLMDAEELCDFVQNTGYAASNGFWVSNFVLRSFFIPGSPGPWDHLRVMKSQYDHSYGYGIVASEPKTVSQLMGLHKKTHVGQLSDLQRKRKSHPYSRTYRRGLELITVEGITI